MDFIIAVFAFFIVLIPLVIIHELGHLVAAKSVGITVLEFGIGIPPRAVKLFTRGGTEYTLNWIPLGGFVRPYGEDFMSPKDSEGLQEDLSEIEERGIENPKSVFEAGPFARIWFFAAGAIFNVITAFLLLFLLPFLGIPEIVDGNVAILNISGDIEELAVGDVITHVNGEKVVTGAEFSDVAEGQSELVLTVKRDDGTTEDVLFTPTSEGDDVPNTRVLIREVTSGSPADEAGLKPNDLIFQARDEDNVVNAYTTQDLIDFTKQHDEVPMTLTIFRDGEIFDLEVVPNRDNSEDVPRIGISITDAEIGVTGGISVANNDSVVEFVPVTDLGEAFDFAVDRFQFMVVETVTLPSRVIQGVIPASQARPVSPIGIGQVAGETVERSQEENNPFPLIGFAAVISFALALTNLLPIPALDGGRILFVLVELLRGKPLAPEREAIIHFIGFAFLFALIIVFAVWDIVDPIVLP